MGMSFEKAVCKALQPFIEAHGYEAIGSSTFRKRGDATVGLVWLVEGTSSREDAFMPRLSIGLSSIGEDVAVLSADLNELSPARHAEWYSAAEVPAVTTALESVGLPWIETHMALPQLTKVLLGRVAAQVSPPARWWQKRTPTQPKLNLNVLRYLSYCYEASGDYVQALSRWNEYASNLTLVKAGSTLAAELEARRESLQARAAKAMVP